MTEYRNYTIRRYVKKKLNYTVLQSIKPHDEFNGFKFKPAELTYEEAKSVMRDIGKPSTWENICNIFETCFNMEEEDFWGGSIKEFFAARNFIIETFHNLIRTEQALLKSIKDIDSMLWEEAGGNRLNKFSTVLPLRQLGTIYSIYPFDLKDKKYQEILLLLTIEKNVREVDAKYSKLKAQSKT